MKRFVLVCWLLVISLALCASLPEGSFDWKNSSKAAPGIRLKEFTLKSPRPLKLYAVKVDLTHPGLYLVMTPPDKDWGKPMPDDPKTKINTLRTRVSDFAAQRYQEGHDIRLAVNASPWGPWKAPFTHKYGGNIGLAMCNGKVVGLPRKGRPAFIERTNGEFAFIDVKEGDSTAGIKNAVSGFQFVLRDGKQVCNNSMVLHPRTFYGLSKDNKTLYILVVDGRQKGYSEGFALCEGAKFLTYLGADDGLNMDGGGSTTLVTCRNGKSEIVNTPPGAGKATKAKKPNYTRKVATSIGICLGGKPQATKQK